MTTWAGFWIALALFLSALMGCTVLNHHWQRQDHNAPTYYRPCPDAAGC